MRKIKKALRKSRVYFFAISAFVTLPPTLSAAGESEDSLKVLQNESMSSEKEVRADDTGTVFKYSDFSGVVASLDRDGKKGITLRKPDLEPLSTTGKIKITSRPSGAAIYIDGGDTGMKTPDLLIAATGEHILKLIKGAKFYEGKIFIESQRRVEVNINSFKDGSIEGMVLVSGGCFQMGDISGDGSPAERPVHEVCLDDYFIAEHEVTQKEWGEVMENNPSNFEGCGENCPVENVSWHDIQEFIRRLNRRDGQNYRLPTEAEWEFAARERGEKKRWAGTNEESELLRYAWYGEGLFGRSHEVKKKRPNKLGIYDMSGNVSEWVSDLYETGYYRGSPKNNPRGAVNGLPRAYRGGAWSNERRQMRISRRNFYLPEQRSSILGFRLAKTY